MCLHFVVSVMFFNLTEFGCLILIYLDLAFFIFINFRILFYLYVSDFNNGLNWFTDGSQMLANVNCLYILHLRKGHKPQCIRLIHLTSNV